MKSNPPSGLADLEGIVAAAHQDSLVMLPAGWLRELLAWVREMERTDGE